MDRSLPGCARRFGRSRLRPVLLLLLLGACAESAPLAAPGSQAGSRAPLMAADASQTQEFGDVPSTATDPSAGAQPQCAQGQHGNWVCVWPVGAWGSAGPCAFSADGALHVARQFVSSDASDLVFAELTRFRTDGSVAWSREFAGGQVRPSQGPRISALVVDRQGIVYWGGEDCDPQASRPASVPETGYYNSCLDARLVALDASGTQLWDWSFGTAAGLERISSIALAPQGLYLAGTYHPPLMLPNQAQIGSAGGSDQYVMHFVDPNHVAWVHTWGSPDHDGNDLRIAAGTNGEVAVTGHLGLDRTKPGFYARLRADGTLVWEMLDDDTYIAGITIAGDGFAYTTPELYRMGKSGERTKLTAQLGFGNGKIRATDHDTLILTSQNADRIVEVDLTGKQLREHVVDAGEMLWYQGGACTHRDSVAVTGHVEHSTDFGILQTPLPVSERSAYLLFLREF
jgi:hypothetical protein